MFVAVSRSVVVLTAIPTRAGMSIPGIANASPAAKATAVEVAIRSVVPPTML